MSERKSWDVQPRAPRPAPEPVSLPIQKPTRQPRAVAPKPRVQSKRTQQTVRRTAPPSGTLRERRDKQRRASRYILLGIFVLLIAGFLYGVWRPTFRIQEVSAEGPGAEVVRQIVKTKLQGTYLYVIPRNSVFFYQQTKMRAAILDAVPEVVAVSLKRDSFSSLAVLTVPRQQSFIWCGTTIDTPVPEGGCYEADVLGYLFKQGEVNEGQPAATFATSTASTTASSAKDTHGQVRVYGSLDTELKDGQSPVRRHVGSADKMADALIFVNAMRTLGAPVSALAIRGDEADLWIPGRTRITYILGHEKEAADTAASVLPTLTLTNGSVQYVDLRFPAKAYVKRYGE